MRTRTALLVPASLLLGFIAVQAGRQWLDMQLNERVNAYRSAHVGTPNAEPVRATLVVAASPLRFGTELSSTNLKEIAWPSSALPAGSFAHLSDVLTGPGKRFALTSLEVDEPILGARISTPGQRANLASVLDDRMRAISVRVDEIVGVAGFVLPGDRVDVLLTRHPEKAEPESDVILQNVRILAVDQINDDRVSKPSVARSVTLEVSTEQAQRVALAQSIGALTLALRGVDKADAESPARVTVADLTGRSASPSKSASDARVPSRSDRTKVAVIRGAERSEYSVPVHVPPHDVIIGSREVAHD